MDGREKIFSFDCAVFFESLGKSLGKGVKWTLVALIFAIVFKMCGF